MTTCRRDFNIPTGAVIGAQSANYLRLLGGASGNSVEILADGLDQNISISLIPKGTGTINIPSSGLIFPSNNPSTVLYLDSTNAVSSSTSLAFDGTDLTVLGKVTAKAFIPTCSTVPPQGMYRYAANSVGISANSTGVMFITSGKVGIGQAPTTYVLETSTDISVHGLRIGLGNSSVSTNLVFGSNALSSNTAGDNNIALGYSSLHSNTGGANNIGIGNNSLQANILGTHNVGVGNNTLYSNVNGIHNIGIGTSSLYTNNSGNNNIAAGFNSLYSNASGCDNISFGVSSLTSNSTGNSNFAAGSNALYSNNSGCDNIGLGISALYNNTVGSHNIGIGSLSLSSNSSGNNNVALGYSAGYNPSVGLTSGSNNTFLGNCTTSTVNNVTNSTAIGNGASINDSNQMVFGNTDVAVNLMHGNVLIDTTSNINNSKLVVNGTIETLSGGLRFPDGTLLNSATSGTLTGYTTSSIAQVTIDSFSTASFRTAKYLVQITSNVSYHVIELLLIQNGTNVYLSQYGEIFTNLSLGVFDASIVAGNVHILFTPTNAATTLRILRQTLSV